MFDNNKVANFIGLYNLDINIIIEVFQKDLVFCAIYSHARNRFSVAATDRREEYRYDAAGRLVFGVRKGMRTGKQETGDADARGADAERTNAGTIGLGSMGNEIHPIHTDGQTFEGFI